MNLNLFNGLPTHPLFVHASAVLVPLIALALVACALWPVVARRFGWLLPVLGLVTMGMVLLTAESGEWLEDRVKETSLATEHAEMGEDLTPWAIGLFVLTVVVWLVGRSSALREQPARADRAAVSGTVVRARLASTPVRVVVLVLSLAVAVGASFEAYRIGESGAKAVWQDNFSQHGRR